MKLLRVLGSVFALLLLTAVPAFAANPHFRSPVVFSLDTTTNVVSAKYDLTGLGNKDVTAVLNVSYETQCRNPGGNIARGQDASSSTTLSNLHPDNGNLQGTISTTPPLVTNESAGCPNDQWTAEVVGPISAVLSFYQNNKLVLQASKTF